MSDFLRRLSDSTCDYKDKNIYQNGTYIIESGQNIYINATGEVVLNYTNTSQFTNQISPYNIVSSQVIAVYGFTSESVARYNGCQPPEQDVSVNSIELAVELLISLVEFGIEAFQYIVFVPGAGGQESVTTIELDSGQILTLHNVSQDALTKDNFIFASSGNSKNDDDFWTTETEVGIGVGGGVLLTSLLVGCYIYYHKTIEGHAENNI